jgi:type III secretory pathway component EscU
MKKSKELKFRAIRFIFSKILQNSLFTIFLAAFIGFAIGAYSKDVFCILQKYALHIIIGLIILIILYYAFSHEKKIIKVNLKSGSLGQEWKNNEFRPHIPSTASISINDKNWEDHAHRASLNESRITHRRVHNDHATDTDRFLKN